MSPIPRREWGATGKEETVCGYEETKSAPEINLRCALRFLVLLGGNPDSAVIHDPAAFLEQNGLQLLFHESQHILTLRAAEHAQNSIRKGVQPTGETLLTSGKRCWPAEA